MVRGVSSPTADHAAQEFVERIEIGLQFGMDP